MTHSGDFLAGSGLRLDRLDMKIDPEQYIGQVGKYEREFNINMTRISSRRRDIQDNMLSYSDHVTRTTKCRLLSESLPDVSVLRVRARHIPEVKHNRKLKPLTLTVSDNNVTKKGEKSRSVRSGTEEDVILSKGQRSVDVEITERRHEKKKAAEVPSKSILNVTDLGELAVRRRQGEMKSKHVWSHIENASNKKEEIRSPTSTIIQDCLKDCGEDSVREDSPRTRAERSRQRREAKTRILLRDAIASLQALEENINNPLLSLPRVKKAKRLTLPKGTLDVIPEIRREEEQDKGNDKAEESIHLSTWRSEPGLKSTTYQHVFPYINDAVVLDDGKYSIKSDPFQSRVVKGQGKDNWRHSRDADGLERVRQVARARDPVEIGDPDIHIKERKRRLQDHARVRLRKPRKMKFLKSEFD